MTLAILPAEVLAAAQQALHIGDLLAQQIDQIAEAPLLVSQRLPGAPGHLAADLDHAIAELRQDLTALLSFAALLGATPVQLSAVDARLAHAVPLPRMPSGEGWLHLTLAVTEAAGTLLTEAIVHATPPETLDAVDPLLGLIPEGPGWAGPVSGPQVETSSPHTPAQWLATITAAEAEPGQITVTHLDNGRWVVSLPGIHSLGEAIDPLDLFGAAHAFATGHGAYANAVVDALALAGASNGAQVMLVGHSQGGIVATDLAADPAVNARWQITHVLTAASPIDDTVVPRSTDILALKNRDDVIPELDLQTGAKARHITTVTFDTEHGSVGANHDLAATYVPFAQSRHFETAPAVRSWEDGAAGYLAGGPATVQRFQLLDRAPRITGPKRVAPG